MDWLKRFHEDRTNLMRILSKFEGNLKDIEYGGAGVNVIWELREFVDLVNKVVIPYFKEVEENIYPRLSDNASDDLSQLIAGLYREHKQLYEAFDGFARVLSEVDFPEYKVDCRGRSIQVTMANSVNIDKMEVPKNYNTIPQITLLEDSLDKETLLLHGYVILQLLEKHFEKEKKAEKLAGSMISRRPLS